MSMFRRPGEDSSSSSETSSDNSDDYQASASHQDSVLSRINTLDSASSGPPVSRPNPPHLQPRQNSAQNVRDLLLHSLLEDKAMAQAAEQLGKDRSDPDVQRLGRETYQEVARQISNNVDDTYANDDMRGHRATAQEGINRLTRNNLSRLAAIPEGSQALVARPPNSMTVEIPEPPPPKFDTVSGLSIPAHLHLPEFPGLAADRYVRDFTELELVGKGGYGRVFKVKHNLDGSFYAVKRIAVSPAKLARIQEHGSSELTSMLEEVRSLARFEHGNIVRYHNAWLEFTMAPTEIPHLPASNMLRTDRLLEDPATFSSASANVDDLQMNFNDLTFNEAFGGGNSADIIFETSDTGGGGVEEQVNEELDLAMNDRLRPKKRGNRRGSHASQATIATISSSSRSRMSAVEDADEEDGDVEMIPRTHMTYSDSDVSESMVSDSDIPGPLMSAPTSGPVLTLNVQMSLYDTNLASFLSSEWSSFNAEQTFHHCFHPCVSLELLSNVISGVEYLHAQGVVHRDLKPANIFLSLSTARRPPYGSVDLSSCKPCSQRDCIHVTPRIGDFGLVAVLGESCLGAETSTKPVGTEFYRPDTSSGISEKLDVFALGVVGFEMLWRFGTRMERVDALGQLRRGQFPDDFSQRFGELGDKVQQLIGDMVHVNERERLSCEEARSEIAKLVHVLKE
ncbi:eukaryotic translation initiation factor 2-alpha kinase-like protein 2 [Dothidotthia symphoricarpi CBS 119687]|uniref:Eukaryotic translation initiation factor 2-alpha kinase-like protein 2 n=1 Tax=Dothidotthia symphoricarpi CBS 119687 TaxID=1392245 RepID=A0A6A6AKP9_9PLEO|nr:eukaryotic translation initiation factor 2-alpha kinase-like protein 2 [Dothidotthia symphoricarpi CBS 119687]KAF2131665.1 eukaryotic translation initiation factor 2-alpha kinase-like protein 2 [Dothidotthia symphoricarpi CBS 119687]